jgi:hypothetical protein
VAALAEHTELAILKVLQADQAVVPGGKMAELLAEQAQQARDLPEAPILLEPQIHIVQAVGVAQAQ